MSILAFLLSITHGTLLFTWSGWTVDHMSPAQKMNRNLAVKFHLHSSVDWNMPLTTAANFQLNQHNWKVPKSICQWNELCVHSKGNKDGPVIHLTSIKRKKETTKQDNETHRQTSWCLLHEMILKRRARAFVLYSRLCFECVIAIFCTCRKLRFPLCAVLIITLYILPSCSGDRSVQDIEQALFPPGECYCLLFNTA